MPSTMKRITRPVACAVAIFVMSMASGVWADDANNPVFGKHEDKPDGSTAVTVGRTLETDWDTKVGVDVNAPSTTPQTPVDRLTNKSSSDDGGSGVAWGSVAVPDSGYVWDKASIEGRIDPLQDKGKLGATLSRSMPIGGGTSLTLQTNTSVIQSLNNAPRSILPEANDPESVWSTSPSAKLQLPTETTFAVGSERTTADGQWRNQLSAEQKIVGPLHVTGAIKDPGGSTEDRRITAGFKTQW